MYVRTAEPYFEQPNAVDVEMAISKLKSGKRLHTTAVRRPSILVTVLLSAFFFVYVVFAQTLN